ncbi:MAG: hypothetical protein IPF92_29400 [Myxococcales bacterium]|nr:hypothetical protein [Myxococcales bacterium]
MRGFPGERPLAVWARAGVAAFAGVVSVAGCAVGIVDDSPPDGPSEVDGAVPTEAGTNTPSTFFTGLSSHKLLSGGYFVVAHTSFSGAKNATYTAGKLAADDGQVGLFDKLDDKVDAVGYGTIAAGNRVLTENNPAPSPGGTGKSVQRVPNGADTNNNQADFRSANSTPNAAN